MRMRERIVLIGLFFAVLLLVGCGGPSAESGPTDKCELDNPPLFEKGVLTVATDKPAYAPWFKGSSKDYSGYEGDIASEIAERMDLPISGPSSLSTSPTPLAPKISTSISTRLP